MTSTDLATTLHRIDGKGYKAYKDIAGRHAFDRLTLSIDHVQADPFAAPSRARVIVPWSVAGLPEHATVEPVRARAARDWLARHFRRSVKAERDLGIDAGAQTVLDRTACLFTDDGVELRFTVHLPAAGRKILGRQAATLLTETLPARVAAAVEPAGRDEAGLRAHCDAVEDQVALREQLAGRGLVAFAAEGAVLPRASGIDDRPLPGAIPFQPPESLAVTLEAPNAGPVRGLGIPRGITLLVGGGFHGKSTLLNALKVGVFDHRPGDGREQVVTAADAACIRAEDGRAVTGVDLSPFIHDLPLDKPTEDFSTDLASGSTSQAAAVMEALEAGTSTLLVDEDTSATNFMIRDRRMQALVAPEDEPITPFLDRIRELRDDHGVSTVLVMGGSGDYLDHADTVIQMQAYRPLDATERARQVTADHPAGDRALPERPLNRPTPRRFRADSLDPRDRKGRIRIKVRDDDTLSVGEHTLDLSAVEPLADRAQLRAIGQILARLGQQGGTIDEAPAAIADYLAAGWEAISDRPDGDLARPRLQEVAAALSRLRGLALAD